MSICVLAERYGVKGQTPRKQYKEKISDYRNWDQLEHAHDYLLYPENIGENLSLDETCLSNGDVYTSMKLTDIFNKKSGPDEARLNLAKWYNEVEKFDYMEFNKVLDTFSNHSTTIINYFEERLTNASAESFNATIKAFRSQLRGVANVKFFMFRLARLYA